jgi:hypothetical protein
VRWQPFAVAALLAAPPVALLGAVWPSSAEPAGGGGAAAGDPEEELTAGEDAEGATNGISSTDFLITGEGELRIDITGPVFDPTLTLIDPDTGDQLDFNDDSNGLDPSLTVNLGDGGSVLAQVRALGGPPGGPFTIAVEQVPG